MNRNFLIGVVLIIVLSAAAEYYFPWWTVAIVAFFVTIVMGFRPGKGFLAGFFGVLALWLIISFIKDFSNEHILSTRMGELFGLPAGFLFIIVAALVGGLVGGLAGWSGAVLRKNMF
jgi:hypothetical protein